MEIIRTFLPYVYIVLIAIIVALLLDLIFRLIKMSDTTLTPLGESITHLSEQLNQVTEKTNKISKTSESWSFFGTLYAISLIFREAGKSYKGDSAPKALTKAVVRHSNDLRKIRF